MKILITGGNSATALKLLKAFTPHEVILADYGEMPNFSSAAYQLVSLGSKNMDTLAHTLLNCCLDEGIDAILPIRDFEVMAIAKAKILFNEFNIAVLLPEADQLADFELGLKDKIEDWIVVKDGSLIFATENVKSTILNNEISNGAFYFKDATTALKLITIS